MTLGVLYLGNSCSNNFNFNEDVGQFKSQSCSMDESTMSNWAGRNPKTGYLGSQKIEYVPREDGRILVDGDKIVLAKGISDSPLPDHLAQGVGVQQGNTWPNGVIPYQISSNLPNPQRVNDAINHWNNLLGGLIRLVPRLNNEPDFVYFVPVTSGCAATVGYFRGAGPHTIEIEPNCGSGNIAHEIGHAVGLDHEQNRKDRDQNITIVWNKVLAGFELNFQIESTYRNYHDYDFNSIMHYSLFAFSTDGSQTIIPKITPPADLYIGQRRGLSLGDVNSARIMYGHGPVTAGELQPAGPALASTQGLFARYFKNNTFSGSPSTKVDGVLNFLWNTSSPAEGVPVDHFSARWTGYLTPDVTGEYMFTVGTTDQINFSFKGEEILTFNGNGQNREVRSLKYPMVQGQRYPIRLDVVAADGPKRLHLKWTKPNGVEEIIPASALVPETAETPAMCGNTVSQ